MLFGFACFEGFADCNDGDGDEDEDEDEVHDSSWVGVLLYGSSLCTMGSGVNSDAVFSLDGVIAGFAASWNALGDEEVEVCRESWV